jgi:hypothetical protein
MFLGRKWEGTSCKLSLLHHQPKRWCGSYPWSSPAGALKIKQVTTNSPDIHRACGHCRSCQRSKQRRGTSFVILLSLPAGQLQLRWPKFIWFPISLYLMALNLLLTSGTRKSISFKHPWSRFHTSGEYLLYLHMVKLSYICQNLVFVNYHAPFCWWYVNWNCIHFLIQHCHSLLGPIVIFFVCWRLQNIIGY